MKRINSLLRALFTNDHGGYISVPVNPGGLTSKLKLLQEVLL